MNSVAKVFLSEIAVIFLVFISVQSIHSSSLFNKNPNTIKRANVNDLVSQCNLIHFVRSRQPIAAKKDSRDFGTLVHILFQRVMYQPLKLRFNGDGPLLWAC